LKGTGIHPTFNDRHFVPCQVARRCPDVLLKHRFPIHWQESSLGRRLNALRAKENRWLGDNVVDENCT
jgi:hypothetical protein